MKRVVRSGAVAFAFTLLGFLGMLAGAGPAAADEITGGCTALVNGQDGALITRDDPLVVQEGAQVEITGNIPAEFAPQNPTSQTTVKVSVIDGLIDITSDEQESVGPIYSADDVNVDDYFDAGVGLYRVEVTNRGEGWSCEYSAYLQLEGDTLSGPIGLIALAAIIVGAIGAFLMKGRKPKEPGWIDAGLGTADQIEREEAWQAAGRDHPDAVAFEERAAHGFMPARDLAPNERVIWSGKVRRHGRWVAGFFWGLLVGVGIGLFGWQDARWTVNLGSIVLLPLAVAVAAGLIAWWGWGYRIRDVVVLPRGAEPPPSEADAEPAGAGSGADVDPVADDNTSPTETPNGSGAGSDPAVLKLDPERTPEV
jgi:hypothetical protein